MIDGDGKRESLLIGTYTDLRRIQESCGSLDEPADVRKRVSDMRVLLTMSVTETLAVKLDSSQPAPANITQLLRPLVATPVPLSTPGGLLNLEPNNGVLIATVVQPERADDSVYLKGELLSILECQPKAVVINLGRVPNLSAGSFNELAGVRDRLRETGAGFALCNVTNAMQQNLLHLSTEDMLPVFESQAKALAALKV